MTEFEIIIDYGYIWKDRDDYESAHGLMDGALAERIATSYDGWRTGDGLPKIDQPFQLVVGTETAHPFDDSWVTLTMRIGPVSRGPDDKDLFVLDLTDAEAESLADALAFVVAQRRKAREREEGSI